MIGRSESVGNLMRALACFQSKIGPIERAIENKFTKTKYADLATILEAVHDPLRESGLVVTQHPVDDGAVETLLYHLESGEWMASTLKLAPKSAIPQDIVGAVTYAKRCALTGILRLRLDRDDDGNGASGKGKPPDKTETARKKTDKALNSKPYAELLDEIQGLREKLKDVEPSPGEAGRFYSRQKAALGLMTADDLANNVEKGREMARNMDHQLTAWKALAAGSPGDDLGVSEDDLPPFGLSKASFKPQHLPLIREWAASHGRPVDEFLAAWEDTAEAALEAATRWHGTRQAVKL